MSGAGFGVHVTAIEPGSFRTARQTASGQQLSNPAKAGAALLRILDEPGPPAHLVLGSDALRLVRAGREAVESDLDTWEDLTLSTGYTPADQAP